MIKNIVKSKTASANRYGASKKGFAMLFTVLVVSIMLAIGLGISDLTYKQTVLSSLANNSQLAFYQSDSGVECGMYYDITLGQFARWNGITGSGSSGVTLDIPNTPHPSQYLTCGATPDNLMFNANDPTNTNYRFTYIEDPTVYGTSPCFSITFDKTDPTKSVVSSRGFSTCSATAEQVERGLQVTY
jgi:hypothetical protein